VKEAAEFTAACLNNTPVPLEFQGAVKAVQVGAWLQEALVSGKQICFDETGRGIDRANLKAFFRKLRCGGSGMVDLPCNNVIKACSGTVGSS
jgi:hypothetical protein